MTYSMFEPKGILNAIDEAGLDIIEETPIREPKQSLGQNDGDQGDNDRVQIQMDPQSMDSVSTPEEKSAGEESPIRHKKQSSDEHDGDQGDTDKVQSYPERKDSVSTSKRKSVEEPSHIRPPC